MSGRPWPIVSRRLPVIAVLSGLTAGIKLCRIANWRIGRGHKGPGYVAGAEKLLRSKWSAFGPPGPHLMDCLQRGTTTNGHSFMSKW